MKRFQCFVCGRAGNAREAYSIYLTCGRCFVVLSDMPPAAQKLMSFVFRRLGALEREIHGCKKARHRL